MSAYLDFCPHHPDCHCRCTCHRYKDIAHLEGPCCAHLSERPPPDEAKALAVILDALEDAPAGTRLAFVRDVATAILSDGDDPRSPAQRAIWDWAEQTGWGEHAVPGPPPGRWALLLRFCEQRAAGLLKEAKALPRGGTAQSIIVGRADSYITVEKLLRQPDLDRILEAETAVPRDPL